jgi:hypothetical protein
MVAIIVSMMAHNTRRRQDNPEYTKGKVAKGLAMMGMDYFWIKCCDNPE